MGGASSTDGGREACIGFWWRNLREGDKWGDPGVNVRMDLQEVGCGSMDWIGLAQDRDRWRTLVNAVMNLRVTYNAGNFLTCSKPVSFSRRTLLHGVSKFFDSQALIINPEKILIYSKNSTNKFTANFTHSINHLRVS
jgi:hypothetical protein